MEKSNFLIVPFLIISTFSFSQDLSRNVIAAQGDFSQNENMTLEWTLGESFIETAITNNSMFTQGFQQSFLTTARLNTETQVKNPFNIVLYPNPVDALLHVYINSTERINLVISLYDVSGKFLKQETVLETDNDVTLDVSDLSSGIYLLKFSNADNSLIETHRIVKH